MSALIVCFFLIVFFHCDKKLCLYTIFDCTVQIIPFCFSMKINQYTICFIYKLMWCFIVMFLLKNNDS